MRHSKLLLGLLSAGVITSTIPIVSLAGCSCRPSSTTELKIDDSLVIHYTDGYVRSKTDTSGVCYLTGFKLESGDLSNLKASVVNLQGIQASTFTEIKQMKQTQYFAVNVYFISNVALATQNATFDLKISDNSGHEITFSGFTVYSFDNQVVLQSYNFEAVQYLGTLIKPTTYTYNVHGTFLMKGSTSYKAEDLKKLKVSLKTASGEAVPYITPSVIVNELENNFTVTFNITDFSKLPSTLDLVMTFTSSDEILSKWSADRPFKLCVLTNADDMFKCKKNDKGKVLLTDCYCTDDDIVVPDEGVVGSEKLPIEIIDNAFISSQAKTITLPDSVTTLYRTPFEKCYNLTKIKFGKNYKFTLEIISDCPNVETFEVDEANPYLTVANNALLSKDLKTLHVASKNTLQIPNTVTKISNCAFHKMSLTEITIPKSVEDIGNNAFEYCWNLKAVSFEEGRNQLNLGDSVFNNCVNLESINLPDCVSKIWTQVFCNCQNLKNFHFPHELKCIGTDAFSHCRLLKKAEFPETLETLCGNSFTHCTSLEEINIPAATNSIEGNPFAHCSLLSSIKVSKDNKKYLTDQNNACLMQIVDNAKILLTGTKNLTIIPQDVKTIVDSAFEGCYGLTQIDLSNAESVGDETFASCQDLVKVILPKNNKIKLADNVFDACVSLETIENLSNVSEFGKYCFCECISLKSADFSDNTDLTNLSDGCFIGCINLENVILPSNLKEIDIDCFAMCSSLKSITIPKTVEKIRDEAFILCTSLENVIFEQDCALDEIYMVSFVGTSSLKNIIIPKSVHKIAKEAFSFSGLTQATFEDTKNWYTQSVPIEESILLDKAKAAQLLLTGISMGKSES